jgi:Pentapeptide repeats (9 copies)
VSAAPFANRSLVPLQAPWVHTDAAFADDRLDGIPIELGMFAHCTFANVSFKGCTIDSSRFMDCTFISCYFRKTEIRNSKFDGCKFFECDFPKVRIQGTSFAFPKFRGCFVEFGEMQPNLPVEPELRSLASAELAREAGVLGHPKDARLYRLQALRAWETHLWQTLLASSSYYKEHYSALERLAAGIRWVGSQLNRLIWGNGERGLTLLFNFSALVLVVFPLLFYALGGIADPQGKATTIDYVLLSVDSVTSYSGLSGIQLVSTAARVVAAFEVIVGLLGFGLFVTVLFRRITRWR